VGGAIGNLELTNRFGELEQQGKYTRTRVGKGGVVLILVVSEGKERIPVRCIERCHEEGVNNKRAFWNLLEVNS
jgi:hypothetical protein